MGWPDIDPCNCSLVVDRCVPQWAGTLKGDEFLKKIAREEEELDLFAPVRLTSPEHIAELCYLIGGVEVGVQDEDKDEVGDQGRDFLLVVRDTIVYRSLPILTLIARNFCTPIPIDSRSFHP